MADAHRITRNLVASLAAVRSEIDRYTTRLDRMGRDRRHRAVQHVERHIECARAHQLMLSQTLCVIRQTNGDGS